LHALNSALVVILIRRWGRDALIALLAGLLFDALPVHTEDVCWIAAYPDLQATLFTLLAALLHTTRFGSRESEWWILRPAGLAICAFLGLLSKETAVVIPVICLAWDFFQHRDGMISSLVAICRERWTDYLGMACGIALYLALRVNALGGLAPYKTGKILPFSTQLFTRITLVYRYWMKILWPAELSSFEDFGVIRTFWDWHVAAGLIAFAITAAVLVLLWRRREPAALGLMIFAVALAPAFALPYGGFNLLAERYLYLPSVGFCWLVAWRLSEMRKRFGNRTLALVMMVLLTAYGLRTVARNMDWRWEVPFYQKAIVTAPNISELHLLAGEAYLRQDLLPQALLQTNTAIALNPTSMAAANNLGQIYSAMNRPAEAAAHYRQAIEDAQKVGAGKEIARVYNNLAYETNRLGKPNDAILLYRKAIQINPGVAAAHNNLGYLYLQHGQYQEAEAELQRSRILEPGSPQTSSNLGLLYLKTGKLDLAARCLNDSLRLEPRSGETYARLGELAIARGDRAQALFMFQQAKKLHPENQRAADGLVLLGGQGNDGQENGEIKNQKSKVKNQK
jgi:tetratricopeptide (TPR) repeat protein